MANMTMADWQTLSERINSVAPSATLAVDSKAKAMKAEGIDVIGFGAGEPNFPTPAAIVAAAAEAVPGSEELSLHSDGRLAGIAQGDRRQNVARLGVWSRSESGDRNQWRQAGRVRILQILLNDGDEVIIPDAVLDELSGSRETGWRRACRSVRGS